MSDKDRLDILGNILSKANDFMESDSPADIERAESIVWELFRDGHIEWLIRKVEQSQGNE